MWKPKLNFISLHYMWILFCSLLSWVLLYPYGNLAAVDAFFFGCSSSTESGLNTIDVKDLKTYQQVYIYVIPMITNLMFVNIVVVVARLYWFRQRLRIIAPSSPRRYGGEDVEANTESERKLGEESEKPLQHEAAPLPDHSFQASGNEDASHEMDEQPKTTSRPTNVTFDDRLPVPRPLGRADTTVLHVPGPIDRINGQPITEISVGRSETDDTDAIRPVRRASTGLSRRRPHHANGPAMRAALSIEKVASSMLVLGQTRHTDTESRRSGTFSRSRTIDLPRLSQQVTVGRNSQFFNLTEQDRETLGGIEYRSLKLLLKVISIYFVGLHLFGVVCLVPWIHNAPSKYKDVLAQSAQDRTWWAIYSAQTMVDNLGFTLTPDSMASFRDATWPMLVMTFLAFAGNTCYPVFLRLAIWGMSKVVPRNSAIREQLQFLLDHPRRCYTLLFPSKPTWILFGIVFALNFIDVLLIIVLDLDNAAVNDLPMGPRILSALFQAASARHTGTATLNLSLVNPAVQFSLLSMMYIAIYPIAISIRASNTYEEKALGIYSDDSQLDESNSASYIMSHVRNQLSFDLWYIFLGTFCICIAESERIVDLNEPQVPRPRLPSHVFYRSLNYSGNVGLSLGHPSVMTSLSGEFTTFSKLVICAMMIRGRHRGLPYSLDRAIMLPSEESSSQSEMAKRAAAEREERYFMNDRRQKLLYTKTNYTL
ncbi:low-affinity potassium transport protein [Colletotrichum tamarilloi]|uniref:Potassium transport protein n=1 Tax=Colletotrichum tamarilloi TaxID=1209934 RepID=A0ABQ9QLA5_9PEZI|nr:low-affinity potassium transport protein [Colletotrichum tamarilloi]KAK1476346.1 low-affinity potassium transport protein [Colletotrichum tamarilloi]